MKKTTLGATTQENKVKNVPTTTTLFIEIPKEETKEKKEKVVYLKEGVTGKQMMNSIYKANNEHKKDLGSLSQCLKRALEFGTKEFKTTIEKFNPKECTPANLVPLRSERNKDKANWSVYEVLMLIKKYYQNKN